MLVNPFPNKPWFFENTVGKGEIARNEQFHLFPQCFLSVWRTFCYFHEVQNCRLQTISVWKSLKFVVWERVNNILSFFPHCFLPFPKQFSILQLHLLVVCCRPILQIWTSLKFCRLVKS